MSTKADPFKKKKRHKAILEQELASSVTQEKWNNLQSLVTTFPFLIYYAASKIQPFQ